MGRKAWMLKSEKFEFGFDAEGFTLENVRAFTSSF